jgi:hypothetical protein
MRDNYERADHEELEEVEITRKCGRCSDEFLSVPRKVRPLFIPLMCDSCDKIIGDELKMEKL